MSLPKVIPLQMTWLKRMSLGSRRRTVFTKRNPNPYVQFVSKNYIGLKYQSFNLSTVMRQVKLSTNVSKHQLKTFSSSSNARQLYQRHSSYLSIVFKNIRYHSFHHLHTGAQFQDFRQNRKRRNVKIMTLEIQTHCSPEFWMLNPAQGRYQSCHLQ